MERNRWNLSGADPSWPARPKTGPQKIMVPSKPIIKEVVKEVEVIKRVEKRVERVVEEVRYVSAEKLKEGNVGPKQPSPSAPAPVKLAKKLNDWDDPKRPKVNKADFKLHDTSYFKTNGSIFKYEVWAGKDKDYYLELEVDALGQKFNLYNFVLVGDQTEENAR